ncbi:MAG TPA: ABC transporter substrate-binding protein [Polyangiaceae bacterium]|nr:ABC transporter substrate-binding protein [Polyangiaceae bacterium]
MSRSPGPRVWPWSVLVGTLLLPLALGARGVAVLDERALLPSRVEGGSYPRTLEDPLGRRFELRAPARRVVSTVLAADEILLELVPQERLAGLTYLIDAPNISMSAGRASRGIPRVYGSAEQMLALEPDLVIVASYTQVSEVSPLLAAGVPSVRLQHFGRLTDIEHNVLLLGRAIGADESAARLVAEMRARIARVKRLPAVAPPPRVLLLDGLFTYGKNTLFDECVTLAGGKNVAAEAGFEGAGALGLEQALTFEPDVVIVTTGKRVSEAFVPQLLDESPIAPHVRTRWRRAVHGLPSSWTGSVSQHVLHTMEALARLIREPAP